MSSKSPVRSCEDVDETALSYAEIKALCAGNPLIAEKMNLDNEVAKLRMLKSEHQNQHYRLEDDVMKRFPEQIKATEGRITCVQKDIQHYADERKKYASVKLEGEQSVTESIRFPGITICGVEYTEKEPAAKALLDACKGVKGKSEELSIGEYMGFKLSLSYQIFGQQINLVVRGAMTYQLDLGTDALGNLTRLNNALEKLPSHLANFKSDLERLNNQMAAAKTELTKPFEQEEELQEKETRLALINADLNIDNPNSVQGDDDIEIDKENDAFDDADDFADNYYDEDEYDNNAVGISIRMNQSAKAKPSILDGIRNFDTDKHNKTTDNSKSTDINI